MRDLVRIRVSDPAACRDLHDPLGERVAVSGQIACKRDILRLDRELLIGNSAAARGIELSGVFDRRPVRGERTVADAAGRDDNFH